MRIENARRVRDLEQEVVQLIDAANPPPRARYIYGRIIADCVDCGEETWWLRGRSTDGGSSVPMEAEAGRSHRVSCLLSNDPDLPIPDEPRCYDCTAYRALPWWRRWLRRHP